jgi:hypothetical protein
MIKMHATVYVRSVFWIDNIPFGRVDGGDISSVISLIHSSFLCTYQIQVGTKLTICPKTGYIYQCQHTHPNKVVITQNCVDNVFTDWLLFKKHLIGSLSYRTIRALFLSGITTVEELVESGTREKFMTIHGIGPHVSNQILVVIQHFKSRMFLS